MRRSRRTRKRLCFLGACLAFGSIFFLPSHPKIVKDHPKIEANTAEDMVIMGKTRKGHPYVIKALHGKKIKENELCFKTLTCTVWGKEISTLSADKGTLDLSKKTLFLEGSVLFSPSQNASFKTPSAYFDYTAEHSWGDQGITGRWDHVGYHTFVQAQTFDANENCVKFKSQVRMCTSLVSVL